MSGLRRTITTFSSKYHYSPSLLQYLSQRYDGLKELEDVLKALTTPSEIFTIRVNMLKTTSQILGEKLKQDGVSTSVHPHVPEALIIHYTGPHQIPKHTKTIIVDKQAAEAVLQGGHLFIPGIKRMPKLHRGENVTVVDKYGRLAGAGIAQMSSSDIQKFSHGVVVRITHPKYKIPALSDLESYKEGLFYSQSLPAILTSMMFLPYLDQVNDEFILDLCAAPGGKTSHLAQLVRNKTQIIAIDRSKRRLAKLHETSQRLGTSCIKTIHADITKLGSNKELKTRFILLDPPCSALGVRPKLFEETTPKSIHALAKYQQKLLKAANEFLKPGGILVYSTCTLTHEENEDLVEFAVRELGYKRPTSIPSKTLLDGILKASDNKTKSCTARFEPHIHGTSGYFIARLIKQQ